MRRSLLGLVLIPTVLLGSTARLSDKDIKAIRAVDAAYVKAAAARDWGSMITLFTADVVMLPPNSPRVQGKEANLTRLQGFTTTSIEYEHEVGHVSGEGTTAHLEGTYRIKVTFPNAPTPFVDRGKYLWVLKKQRNGSWLVARIMWNSDLPAPPG